MTKPTIRRCAIYTRKSSEEGLEQEFNSLHAQREACEAYVKSQAGEGWRAIATAYDDGGISGGTMDRPGLSRLLADVALGKVDVVVVYKVDRLTRALSDFAKMVEIFDAQQVSFVSVTQAFNTTSSMGRLTLNVLLSFAQFEREVTGERIRDKIRASKQKGLWMGGNLPLGYDAQGRVLVVNEAEAQQVRAIFDRYLEIGSVHALREELTAKGIASKQRLTLAGRTVGGGPFSRGALYHLLSNPVYVGDIRHRAERHAGQHSPIVSRDVFEAVQARLAANTVRTAASSRAEHSPLTGKLFDSAGEAMSPTFSYGRAGRRYRYYVTAKLQQGGRTAPGYIRRLPAASTEAFVREAIARLVGSKPSADWDELAPILDRVDARPANVLISLNVDAIGGNADPAETLLRVSANLAAGEQARVDDDGERLIVSLPVRVARRGGRTWMIGAQPQTSAKRRLDRALIGALRKAHKMLGNASPLLPAHAMAEAAECPSTYDRKLMRLAFLAPDIQEAILEGGQPSELNLKTLVSEELPACWEAQRARFGFNRRSAAPHRALPASS